MTTAPLQMTVQQARETLRAASLRSTTSRVAVLQHVAGAGKPLSHAEVADVLVPQGFDKSTLYRCLVELADAGLLGRLDAGDHAWRFELRRASSGGLLAGGEHSTSEHPHFVCVDCGKVTCLPDVDVKISPSKGAKSGALGDVTEVYLKGHCKECLD
jgi:Fur family transcriptional regulator, ferric uptake regulator